MTNEYDELHPHQRDGRNEPVVVDGKGRCLVCSRDMLDQLRTEHKVLLLDFKLAQKRGDAWREIAKEDLKEIEILNNKYDEVLAENSRLREEKDEQLKEENYLREGDA